jgi:hypothetical protein
MLAFRLLTLTPLVSQCFLRKVQQKIREGEPVSAPMESLPNRHQSVTVICERDDRPAMALLLTTHVLLRFVRAHGFPNPRKRVCRGACLRRDAAAAFLELPAALTGTRCVSANFHCGAEALARTSPVLLVKMSPPAIGSDGLLARTRRTRLPQQ